MNWVCIDFGTCNTAAAIVIDGAPHVVSFGNRQFFPTVACVLDDGKIEVCQDAESLRASNPETFKQEFKLHIADHIDICSVTYVDIVAAILSYIKECAELENNGERIDKAVLTIPAVYTEADRRKNVMKEAASKAGFTQIEFISEPQAAAMHYARITGQSNMGLSLIYDLGGGTFDPALLEIRDKKAKLLGHEAGVECGGHYFDRAIYNHISVISKESGKPLDRHQRLEDYAACRQLKETLSVRDTATRQFSNGEKYTIDRETFHSQIKGLIDITLQACDNLLSTAGRKWNDINQVLLVGGSTAIPLIPDMLSRHALSHNASKIKIVRNARGEKGEYNHRFATCLGGIAGKIIPPPPPAERIARLSVAGREIGLKMGKNTFGRGEKVDFRFDDPTMSRHHFNIVVTKGTDNRLNYTLTTKSTSKATIINNLEALDLRFAPISRISAPLFDGNSITAGNTLFILKK